uniref:Uncharacterized protein n=1 Tax=Solanum tuberosum TaxID=4113 RepID=M1CX85_SOLTU
MALCSIYKYGSKAQGLAFLAFGSISFLVFVYAAIVSKLLPPFDNPILAAIQNDRKKITEKPMLLVEMYYAFRTTCSSSVTYNSTKCIMLSVRFVALQ